MKKHFVIFVIVFLVTIGYAATNTVLDITGNLNLAENIEDFKIEITNLKINNNDSVTLISKDKQSFTFTGSGNDTLEYTVANNSYQYDANIILICVPSENVYIEQINNLPAQERSTKSISSTNTSEITCTINIEKISRTDYADESKGGWVLTEDNDNDGVPSKGDLITLGTESFYVYDIEGDTVKAITQYNLHVGNILGVDDLGNPTLTTLENPTGLQDSRARGAILDSEGNVLLPFVGTVAFTLDTKIDTLAEGQKANDYSVSDIKEYVDAYAIKLSELNGGVNIVRLITKEELEKAGCNSEKNSCKAGYAWSDGRFVGDSSVIGAPEFLWSTTYWTSSPDADNELGVWDVGSDGDLVWSYVDYDSGAGVRPVIELSKSLF